MALKSCKHCDGKFESERSTKYCSLDCALWSRVKKTERGCWDWIGAQATGGYGTFKWNGNAYRSNRAALIVTVGQPPGGADALHSCDRPCCCNPLHLRWGTHKENMADRLKRGRANMPKGESHHRASLTFDQVAQIKQLLGKRRQIDIALDFGIPRSRVADIAAGRSWKE